MRYTTPTHPVYRHAGWRTVTSGPYPGKYATYKLVGYEPGVPVPNPGHVPPKAGHWRVSPRGKLRPKPRKHAAVFLPANVGPQRGDLAPVCAQAGFYASLRRAGVKRPRAGKRGRK